MRHFQCLIVGLAFMLNPWGACMQAQSTAPQSYSVSETSYLTEVSMFTGQAANLKLSRRGSKELVELTVPPWGGNPQGVHMRYLFDFEAHKAYQQHLDTHACAWIKYISARAPKNYDPVTSAAGDPEFARAKQHSLGTETVNGIPAYITESDSPQGKIRMWLAQRGDFPVKMQMAGPDGKPVTLLEVKHLDFSPPAASLFVPPGNCATQAQGEWSDTEMSGHAEAKIEVRGSASANSATGETHEHFTATTQQGSPAAGSAGSSAKAGGSEGDFVDNETLPFQKLPPRNECTVLFRVVRAGSMEPVLGIQDLTLDGRDVTGQYRNGVLRISNPPARFSLGVQPKNDAGRGAQMSRACFQPETVLLLVIGKDFFKEPDKWLWVKSGKYATVPK
jgi:hypothetical protein